MTKKNKPNTRMVKTGRAKKAPKPKAKVSTRPLAKPNKAGKPPKYRTPEQLQKKIDLYITDKTIKPTISGLAYYLGFSSRQSFYDYEKREKFSYTIKRARLFIEAYYEDRLTGHNSAGAIFALKNFGWKDTQELTGADGQPLQAPQIIILNNKVQE